jgi:hypothetical protein
MAGTKTDSGLKEQAGKLASTNKRAFPWSREYGRKTVSLDEHLQKKEREL